MYILPTSTATPDYYPLSLHDALPIYPSHQFLDREGLRYVVIRARVQSAHAVRLLRPRSQHDDGEDRKSTRLNSSHVAISYAVFCLKKKTIVIIINLLQD